MLPKPRKHQEIILSQLLKSREQHLTVMLGVGSGKTTLFFLVATHSQNKGKRFLFVVPKIALADQTASYPVDVGLLQGSRSINISSRIVIATIETLENRIESGVFNFSQFHEIWIDESHEEVKKIESLRDKALPYQRFIYLSATPYDGIQVVYKHLQNHFLGREFGYDYMIAHGYLCPMVTYEIGDLDTSHIERTDTGNYIDSELLEAIHGSDIDIVSTSMARIDREYPTLVMCQNIDHAKEVAEQYRAYDSNLRVATVYAGMEIDIGIGTIKGQKAIDHIIRGTRAFEYDVVTFVRILTTGVDIPNVGNLVIATKIGQMRSLIQYIGRGLRNYDGDEKHSKKRWCNVIDIFGSIKSLGHPLDEVELLMEKPKKTSSAIRCKACGSKSPLVVVDSYQEDNDIIMVTKCRECGEEDIRVKALKLHFCSNCKHGYIASVFKRERDLMTTCPMCSNNDVIGSIYPRELIISNGDDRERVIKTIVQLANTCIPKEDLFPFLKALEEFSIVAEDNHLSYILEKLIAGNKITNINLLTNRMVKKVKNSVHAKIILKYINRDELAYIENNISEWKTNPNRVIGRVRKYVSTPKKRSVMTMLKGYKTYLQNQKIKDRNEKQK
jgi:superfamily II DNA or RNA helicase